MKSVASHVRSLGEEEEEEEEEEDEEDEEVLFPFVPPPFPRPLPGPPIRSIVLAESGKELGRGSKWDAGGEEERRLSFNWTQR